MTILYYTQSSLCPRRAEQPAAAECIVTNIRPPSRFSSAASRRTWWIVVAASASLPSLAVPATVIGYRPTAAVATRKFCRPRIDSIGTGMEEERTRLTSVNSLSLDLSQLFTIRPATKSILQKVSRQGCRASIRGRRRFLSRNKWSEARTNLMAAAAS